MLRRPEGRPVPGALGPTSDAQFRAGTVATDSNIAFQLSVAPAPAAGTATTAAPSPTQPQLKLTDSVLEA